MNNLSPFVVWDLKESKNYDGLLFSVPNVCKSTKKKICNKFYNEIAEKKDSILVLKDYHLIVLAIKNSLFTLHLRLPDIITSL